MSTKQRVSTPVSEPVTREVLLVAEPGVATSRVESTLTDAGHRVTRVSPGEAELFEHALGKPGLVFLPTPNLLAAQLEAPPSAHPSEALEGVLRASRAPGVEVLVVALPAAPHFDPALDAVARHGKPFIVVRTPGLLEEAAQALESEGDTLWLPRSGEVLVSRGAELGAAVVRALSTDEQGRVAELPTEGFDIAALFATAASLSGRPVRVRAVTPVVYRVVRPVARWLKGSEPPLLALADRLLSQPVPASSRALAS